MAQLSFLQADAGMRNLGNYAMKRGGLKAFRGNVWDTAVSSGMAYLTGELEKWIQGARTADQCDLAARYRC